MSLLKEFSIQLYAVREETAKDFLGVLDKLGEIGYTGVEFAGYGGIDADVMKKALDKNGIKSVGSHVMLERLEDEFDAEVAYNTTLGTKFIVCPYAVIKNREETLQLAERLNVVGDKLSKAGFRFGYHNHHHEFVKDGDEYLLDILFNNVDKSKVFMELDMYWVSYAGVDALDYLSKNAGTVKLLHLKQIKDFESKKCVDLNEGVLDFSEIIKKGLQYGVEDFILEQEEFAISPFVSVKNGFEHIMSLK